MFQLLRDLAAHKEWADTLVLNTVARNAAATRDEELCGLFHHILLANRFWLLAFISAPFDYEHESRAFGGFDDLTTRYRETQAQERLWLATSTDADLARSIDSPLIPGTTCTVAQGLTQVCMHSQGHRAQIAKVFRRHGGVPPMTDFVLWLANRPTADWITETEETR
jgi:uncharacterized damage-inducible protein DinB